MRVATRVTRATLAERMTAVTAVMRDYVDDRCLRVREGIDSITIDDRSI
ncbi:hypothetical protein BCAR13_110008 [Paraburkholderia caribensis]|nr:hypothetical protein BCAR13_110008 [Paraburkholderia caribensis]